MRLQQLFAKYSLLPAFLVLMGCRSDGVEATGPDFIKTFEKRKPDEKYVFREDLSGFYYLDCYRMGKTESVFQKIGSLRTSTNNLSIEQVVKLKEKATKGEWAMPFLKK
jgi:hypothetical protein